MPPLIPCVLSFRVTINVFGNTSLVLTAFLSESLPGFTPLSQDSVPHTMSGKIRPVLRP